jgi:RNase P/RNase MRP subunit p30
MERYYFAYFKEQKFLIFQGGYLEKKKTKKQKQTKKKKQKFVIILFVKCAEL